MLSIDTLITYSQRMCNSSCSVFNFFFNECYFWSYTVPIRWNQKNAVTIHKKSDKSQVVNYKPILILSGYNVVKPLFNIHQHATMTGKSCTTHLLIVYAVDKHLQQHGFLTGKPIMYVLPNSLCSW